MKQELSSAVSKVDLPACSALHARVDGSDFLDCYSVASGLTPRQAAHVIVDFPGWARALLQVRRLVTAPFGLSNDAPSGIDAVGIFPIESESTDELIAGFDDKHLDFRIAVRRQGGRIHLATWVHCHNIGGRIYLAAIMPFHIAISRDALARVGRTPAHALPG